MIARLELKDFEDLKGKLKECLIMIDNNYKESSQHIGVVSMEVLKLVLMRHYYKLSKYNNESPCTIK